MSYSYEQSVIVVTAGLTHTNRRLFTRLAALRFGGMKFQIVVVQDGTPCPLLNQCLGELQLDVTHVLMPKEGWSVPRALHAGRQAASGFNLVFLQDDVICEDLGAALASMQRCAFSTLNVDDVVSTQLIGRAVIGIRADLYDQFPFHPEYRVAFYERELQARVIGSGTNLILLPYHAHHEPSSTLMALRGSGETVEAQVNDERLWLERQKGFEVQS